MAQPLNRIVPPGLDQLLRRKKQETKTEINCMTIGNIVSFDPDEQTASVQIVFKRVLKANTFDANGQPQDKIVNYPTLVKCPVVVLAGGGGYMTFPIQEGDTCIVLFCDRDIDAWWSSGNTDSPPNSERVHDLSDGIALVGIRSQADPIEEYSTTKIKIQLGGAFITISETGHIVISGTTVHINPVI